MCGEHQTGMKRIHLPRTFAAAIFLVAATVGGAAAVTASAAAPSCGITWGSLPRVNDTMSPAALGDVRTGRHDCYDRVVFDFDAPASGYHVEYADHVYSQGKGDVLNVAGA